MSKKLLIEVLLFFISYPILGKEQPKIFIQHFSEVNNKVPALSLSAENRLTDFLTQMGCVKIIEKTDIESILTNENLPIDSITEEKLSLLSGKLRGIDFIISGEVSGGAVSRDYQTKRRDDGTTDTFWQWKSTPAVRIKIVRVSDGKLVYSDTKKALQTMEEDHKETSTVLDVANMVKSHRTRKQPVEIDPNLAKPDMAITATMGSVYMHLNEIYNLFRPSGVIINIEPKDSKGKKQVVSIDLGENFGIKKNDKFQVIKIATPIKHPTTGEMIQGKETIIKDIKIKDVDKELSTTIIRKKDLEKISIGMIVKAEAR